jgi:hypothetical protein
MTLIARPRPAIGVGYEFPEALGYCVPRYCTWTYVPSLVL